MGTKTLVSTILNPVQTPDEVLFKEALTECLKLRKLKPNSSFYIEIEVYPQELADRSAAASKEAGIWLDPTNIPKINILVEE